MRGGNLGPMFFLDSLNMDVPVLAREPFGLDRSVNLAKDHDFPTRMQRPDHLHVPCNIWKSGDQQIWEIPVKPFRESARVIQGTQGRGMHCSKELMDRKSRSAYDALRPDGRGSSMIQNST